MKAKGYLIYDWRNNDIKRVNSTKKGEIGPHEIRIPVEVQAEKPEINVQSFAAELNVTEGDVRAVLGDELVEEPELRIKEMPNPTEVVFSLTMENYEEKIEEFLEVGYTDSEALEDGIDWWRSVISTEHKEMNRPRILEEMEKALQDLKDRRGEN